MKFILNWVWQLPQHLLALLLIWVTGAEKMRATEVIPINIWKYDPKNWFNRYISGVSLGMFIILPMRAVNMKTVLHEHGHSIQSRAWGPLYLLAVGIPSAVFNNLWDRLFHKNWPAEKRIKWYYSRYPEKQADKLGGVVRDFQGA